MKKKLLSALLSTAMVASLLVGCGSDSASTTEAPADDAAAETTEEAAPADDAAAEESTDAAASGDKFYIYSWNTELQERLKYVFEANPGMEERIEYVNVGDSNVYQEKIDQLLQTPDAEDYPDMIAFEAGYIMKYTNSDYTLPVTDCGVTDADLAEMYPYTITIATDQRDGSLKGVSWQSCPGAFMYRTDLAEKYLGVTSPEEMQAKISTWDDFLATAKELKEASGDATRILSSNGDVSNVFYSNKSEPWVTSDGVFHMDDAMVEYMEVSKALEQDDLTQKTTTWTEEWNAGPSTDSVLGYFGCTWFLHWTIKSNCGGEKVGEGTYGLWNMCQGPAPYYWGGTWLGATAGCSDTALAGQIMKSLCCDTEIMTKMSEETLDYVNNKTAMKTLSDAGKGAYDFLGGQDFIAVFSPLAEDIDVSWMSAYDLNINNLLGVQIAEYQSGNKDLDTAIADFKQAVKDAYPSVTVE
ncbi:MAG: ABC transporter substrate-binding protein [Lachnospiraceae bacterium]|nr:ABC transporter substrate-binding protein [Lachnospiraceae bacterium]